jgi:glycine/D-amino acid oxidase-like deaminating enzyme
MMNAPFEEQDQYLEKFLKAHRLLDTMPFEVTFRKAIEINGQAQCHPLKYLKGRAKSFENNGGTLKTETCVTGYKSTAASIEVYTADDNVCAAKNLVWTTHHPPGGGRVRYTSNNRGWHRAEQYNPLKTLICIH